MAPKIFEDTVFSSICKGINHLHSSGHLFDLVVEVGKSTFSCHGLVLAAVSEFFQTKLVDGNPAGFIRIQDEQISPNAFGKILDVLYTGKDPVSDMDMAMEVFLAASILKIDFLTEHCKTFLLENVSSKTCLETWQFAMQLDFKELEHKSLHLAAENFEDVCSSLSFPSLPRQLLLVLLSSEKLKVSRQDNLCNAILIWVRYGLQERKSYMPELLPFIRFCDLSEPCIRALRTLLNQYDSVLIEEALLANLETAYKLNSKTRSEIITRQWGINSWSEMERFVIVIGGTTASSEHTTCVNAFAVSSNEKRQLSPLPTDIGTDFATCVWRNELYVSGGTLSPTFFAVYNAGIDEWKTLECSPRGKWKHVMAAVNWNVYLIGGVEMSPDGQNVPVAEVMTYNISTKFWSTTSPLVTAVQDASAAVLGHTIYVIGGRDAEGNATSHVQCVNTLTNCVYLAGHLPSPTCGARAFSTGGAIYVVRGEGDVLFMKVNFQLENQQEQELKVRQFKAKQGELEDREDALGAAANNIDCNTQGLVNFIHLATISKRRHFGVYQHQDKLYVCGGQDDNGTFLGDVVSVELNTGLVTQEEIKLSESTSHFEMQVLNFLKETDTIIFRVLFKLDSLPKDDTRICYDYVRHKKFDWYLGAYDQGIDELGKPTLGLYLFKRDSDRKWIVKTKFTMWIVPTKPGSKELLNDLEFTFEDSKPNGYGSTFSLEELKDESKGYTKNNELTVQISLTITEPPELEENI